MLIEFGDALGFTAADFTDWCIKIGFERVDILPLAGPMTAGWLSGNLSCRSSGLL